MPGQRPSIVIVDDESADFPAKEKNTIAKDWSSTSLVSAASSAGQPRSRRESLIPHGNPAEIGRQYSMVAIDERHVDNSSMTFRKSSQVYPAGSGVLAAVEQLLQNTKQVSGESLESLKYSTLGLSKPSSAVPCRCTTGQMSVGQKAKILEEAKRKNKITKEEQVKKGKRACDLFEYIDKCKKEERDLKYQALQEKVAKQRAKLIQNSLKLENTMKEEQDKLALERATSIKAKRLALLNISRAPPQDNKHFTKTNLYFEKAKELTDCRHAKDIKRQLALEKLHNTFKSPIIQPKQEEIKQHYKKKVAAIAKKESDVEAFVRRYTSDMEIVAAPMLSIAQAKEKKKEGRLTESQNMFRMAARNKITTRDLTRRPHNAAFFGADFNGGFIHGKTTEDKIWTRNVFDASALVPEVELLVPHTRARARSRAGSMSVEIMGDVPVRRMSSLNPQKSQAAERKNSAYVIITDSVVIPRLESTDAASADQPTAEIMQYVKKKLEHSTRKPPQKLSAYIGSRQSTMAPPELPTDYMQTACEDDYPEFFEAEIDLDPKVINADLVQHTDTIPEIIVEIASGHVQFEKETPHSNDSEPSNLPEVPDNDFQPAESESDVEDDEEPASTEVYFKEPQSAKQQSMSKVPWAHLQIGAVAEFGHTLNCSVAPASEKVHHSEFSMFKQQHVNVFPPAIGGIQVVEEKKSDFKLSGKFWTTGIAERWITID